MINQPPSRRRHGAELEAAILDAAWAELVEAGYARLTMESVARRARTSEPVLYRRWPNKDQLVLAAMKHHRSLNPIAIPDTGALRTDLIALLTNLSEALAGFFAIAAATSLNGLMSDSGLSPAQTRRQIMNVQPVHDIYRRAAARGEIDLERIPEVALELPFDLLRHDLLMHMEPASPERVRAIVDDLTLPLIKN